MSDDEHLRRWFTFSDSELKKLLEALICSPKIGPRRQRMIEEIRAVRQMRNTTPHE